MNSRGFFRSTALAVLGGPLLCLLGSGCGSPSLAPIDAPAPPPPTATAPSAQFTLAAPQAPRPAPLEPLPTAALKVGVLARETLNGREATEDRASESLVAATLLAGRVVDRPISLPNAESPPRPPRPRLEILSRSVYESALDRDARALLLREKQVDVAVLRNLAGVGCQLLAVADLSVTSLDPTPVGREVRDRTYAVDATVSLVRVDDAVTLGAGSGTARRSVAPEAKREALESATTEALRQFYDYRDVPATQVMLTVEGLRSEAEADKIEKALQATRGVLWVKDVRFQLGPEGTPSSVARFDVGWNGKADDLKQVLRDWDLGFRLTGTRMEGNRWTFRAEPALEEVKK